jgi:hypothetical protein
MTWANFYLVCFVVGFALSLISLFGGFGDNLFHEIFPSIHLDHAGLGDGGLESAESHGGVAGVHASPFNFSTLMAFLAWFGGTGYLLTRYSGLWSLLALALALVGGFAGAAIVFWFLVKVLLANETVLNPSDFDMVGVLARVSSGIRSGGTGEIVFSQAGVRRPSGARSEDGLAIPKGKEVVVTRYEKGIAYVRLWDDVAKDEFDEVKPKQGEAPQGMEPKRRWPETDG